MMKNLKAFFCIFSVLLSAQVYPCSTISYDDQEGNPWVIKSFDFSKGDGFVFLNKKNISKRSLTLSIGFGHKWTSQYGSVTFNQIGRDFPYGGINEAGLNMEIMWLDETEYPKESSFKNQINESQLIQYILDTAASTSEALEKIKKISLTPIMAPVHYMICDTNSECASVEYLNQKLVINKMNKGKERILQNSIYSQMLNNSIRTYGSTIRNSASDLDFIFNNQAASTEEDFVKKSFQNLDYVYQNNWSRWQIVYNLKQKKLWFRTLNTSLVKVIDLNDYDFDCRTNDEEKIIDIDSPTSGDVRNNLANYSSTTNRKLLTSFEQVPKLLREVGHLYTSMKHNCVK